MGGADEVEVDDIAAQDGVVAVAEGCEQIGVGHYEMVSRWNWVQPLTCFLALERHWGLR